MNRPVLSGFATVVVLSALVVLIDPAYVKGATGIVIGAAAQVVAMLFFATLKGKNQ